MATMTSHAMVSSGNAHHNRNECDVVAPAWLECEGTGGSSTLVGTVLLLSSSFMIPLIGQSVTGVTIRSLLVVILTLGAIFLLGRSKPARPAQPIVVRVANRITPLYRAPDQQRRLVASGSLGAGAIVIGAVVAVLISVVIAYAVTTVTGLLR
ncbi:MAG: hypothetical protein ACYC0U_07520 [Ilumatobacteraceae bacterium]